MNGCDHVSGRVNDYDYDLFHAQSFKIFKESYETLHRLIVTQLKLQIGILTKNRCSFEI